jgi:hypothetical protein
MEFFSRFENSMGCIIVFFLLNLAFYNEFYF